MIIPGMPRLVGGAAANVRSYALVGSMAINNGSTSTSYTFNNVYLGPGAGTPRRIMIALSSKSTISGYVSSLSIDGVAANNLVRSGGNNCQIFVSNTDVTGNTGNITISSTSWLNGGLVVATYAIAKLKTPPNPTLVVNAIGTSYTSGGFTYANTALSNGRILDGFLIGVGLLRRANTTLTFVQGVDSLGANGVWTNAGSGTSGHTHASGLGYPAFSTENIIFQFNTSSESGEVAVAAIY